MAIITFTDKFKGSVLSHSDVNEISTCIYVNAFASITSVLNNGNRGELSKGLFHDVINPSPGGSAVVMKSIAMGTGITLQADEHDVVINITDTSVTAGTYTFPKFTVNAQGQITDVQDSTADIRGLFTVTRGGNSTGGAMSYNNSTGLFTYNPVNVAGEITGGTGVTNTAGTLSIGQDVSNTSDVTFKTIQATRYTGPVTGAITGDLTGAVIGNVTGDLTGAVTGDVTGDLTGDIKGHVRNQNNSVILSNGSDSVLAQLTGQVSDVSNHDTDSITEGADNKYFTNTRARSSVSVQTAATASGEGAMAYNTTTGKFTFTPADVSGGAIAALGVANVAGGDGSLAYADGTYTYSGPTGTETQAHFDAGVGLKYQTGTYSLTATTTQIIEGDNKYFTAARAQNALSTQLEGKSDTGHVHVQSDITGLTAALAGKSGTGHKHVQSDITGLTAALAGKSNTGHAHVQSDITGLTAALADKSDTGHAHVQSDITGLTAALAGKSNMGHGHAQSDITGLVTALAGKSDTIHAHTINDMSNVVIQTPTAGQVLVYDDTMDVWINQDDITSDTTSISAISGEFDELRVDGNVGIGNTNPSHDLTLGSSTSPGTTDQRLKIYRGAGDPGQNLEMGYKTITVTRNDILANPQSTFSIFQKGSDGKRNAFHLDVNGNVGIGDANPAAKLDVNGDTIRVRDSKTPASQSADGSAGEIVWDANYVYVCVAANTWKRSALSTW